MTTIAQVLRAIQAAEDRTVHVFCHVGDYERATTAFEVLPSVRVIAHGLVPPGKIWITPNRPALEGL